MVKRYFITGTDTHIGKTTIACGLLSALSAHKVSTIALKPLAAGCVQVADKYFNADALALQTAASVYLPYELINPFPLLLAIAPHLAAAAQNINLSVRHLMQVCMPALSTPATIYIIEGAGGWLVPLNAQETLADLAAALRCEIILVVGMRLGCLNHALLTYRAIISSGLRVCAWVANCIEPDMPNLKENIATLTTQFAAPLMGVVPYNGDAARALNLAFLLQANFAG